MSMMSRTTHPALSMTDGVAMSTSDFLLLVGRILLGWVFIRYGYLKIFDIGAFANTMPGRGLPGWLAYISVPFEFFGGILLILGLATRYVALGMIIFLLVAAFSSHAYWAVAEAQRGAQESHFWKNLAILGGMVYLFATGPGKWSLDHWLAKK